MNISVVTGPETEPVTLTEAKTHLRVEHDADDTLITSLVTAAREWCEGFLNRALITQTRRLAISSWPIYPLRLSGIPIQSIESVTYVDSDGETGTVAADQYRLTASGELIRTYNGEWPSVTLMGRECISITYKCGWASADYVPRQIKQAMLLLIGAWYETREGMTEANRQEVPFGVRELLYPLRDVVA